MISAGFVNVEAGLQIEDGLAVLDGDNPPRGEAAAVANSVDLVQDRHQRIARAQEVGVQRVHLSTRVVDGACRGHQRLTCNLATEDALTTLVG